MKQHAQLASLGKTRRMSHYFWISLARSSPFCNELPTLKESRRQLDAKALLGALQWGMEVTRISEQDIMLRGLPTLFAEVVAQEFVQALVTQQPANDKEWIQVLSDSAAVHDQRDWTMDAMQLLVNEMGHYQLWQLTQTPGSIWKELDEAQLAKLFND